MTSRKPIPNVQSDAAYEQSYALRKSIADEAAAHLAAAIEACGEGAATYGRHVVHDKLGIEPTCVIYCCRGEDGAWQPPAPAREERIFRECVVVTTPSGVKYETRAVTVPAGQFAEHAVSHFPRRYEVSTVAIECSYKPRAPDQLRAAAERRRAKAIAEVEAAEAAELERKRAAAHVQPSLFGEEP